MGVYNARDNLNHFVARHMPNKFLMWCCIVASVRVTEDHEDIPSQTLMGVVKRLDK